MGRRLAVLLIAGLAPLLIAGPAAAVEDPAPVDPVPAPTTTVPAPTTTVPVPAPTTTVPVPAPTTTVPAPAPTTTVPAPTTTVPAPAPVTSDAALTPGGPSATTSAGPPPPPGSVARTTSAAAAERAAETAAATGTGSRGSASAAPSSALAGAQVEASAVQAEVTQQTTAGGWLPPAAVGTGAPPGALDGGASAMWDTQVLATATGQPGVLLLVASVAAGMVALTALGLAGAPIKIGGLGWVGRVGAAFDRRAITLLVPGDARTAGRPPADAFGPGLPRAPAAALSCTLLVVPSGEPRVGDLFATLLSIAALHGPQPEVVVMAEPGDPLDAHRTLGAGRVVRMHIPLRGTPPAQAWDDALAGTSSALVGVLQAGDRVHPDLLERVRERLVDTGAHVVQAGVVALDHHLRPRRGVRGKGQLGPSSVFLRASTLRSAGGWQGPSRTVPAGGTGRTPLTDLGLRLAGRRTAVSLADPRLVTRAPTRPAAGRAD